MLGSSLCPLSGHLHLLLRLFFPLQDFGQLGIVLARQLLHRALVDGGLGPRREPAQQGGLDVVLLLLISHLEVWLDFVF